MIIRTKVRPKEQTLFSRYFGDLKHSIVSIQSDTQEEAEERKMDEKQSTMSVISCEKIFVQTIINPSLRRLRKNTTEVFFADMNNAQKYRIRAFVEYEKLALKIIKGIDLQPIIEGLDKNESLKIYEEILSEGFINWMREEKPITEIALHAIDPDTTVEAGTITSSSDFSGMEFPKEVLPMIEQHKLSAKEKNLIKYYYMVLLNSIVYPFFESTVYTILLNRNIYWALVRITKKMDPLFRDYWQNTGKIIKDYTYGEVDEFLYKELLEGMSDAGKKLVDENYYFNIASGILMNFSMHIRLFYELPKEGRNIVINEAVNLASKISKKIEADLKGVSANIFDKPEENEPILQEIYSYVRMFKFSQRVIEEILLKKGVHKEDWIFFFNLLRINLEVKYMDEIYQKYEHADLEFVNYTNSIAINYSLNSAKKLNPNMLELCTYALAYKMSVEKTEEEAELSSKYNELMKALRIKSRVNLDKNLMLDAQRKKGVAEKQIKLFCFLCENSTI